MAKTKAPASKVAVVDKRIAFDKAVEKKDKATATKLYNELKGKLTPIHKEILKSKLDKLK